MVEYLYFSKMNDNELQSTIDKYNLGLTVEEARKVAELIWRDPTMVEAVIFWIQGSEHASYRSSRKFLKTLPVSWPNVILWPCEDSGIVELCKTPDGKDKYGIIVSHESHNAPSQVVPYEGAATGVWGIIRDIICMWGKAIATLDPLRFGEIENHKSKIISHWVVEGIAGYGNPIGVPNLWGDVYFDNSFNSACLVNVVAFGLIKESDLIHSFAPAEAGDEKYDYIIIGKWTDNSGFWGSSFASRVIDENKKESNKAAVQEPNPFLERHIMASTYDLFKILKEWGNIEKVWFKDMWAWGNLCATVELISEQGFGADIDIDRIHTTMDNLKPEVIACSETQERFCWVCHPSLTQMILNHYNKKWDLPTIAKWAGASHIWNVTNGWQFVMKFKWEIVCNAQAKDITKWLYYERPFQNPNNKFIEPEISDKDIDIEEEFKKLLGSENIASRQSVYENYDSTVQWNTIIEAGEADAWVIAPLTDEDIPEEIKKVWIAISADGSGRQWLISPYWQAANAVVESMRNVACVWAVPQCLTDCLNYWNPEDEKDMWTFVEGVRWVKDATENVKLKGFDNPTPIVSGNVSLYKNVSPSAIISCVGKIENTDLAITSKLKKEGSKLLLLGKRKDELWASEFYRLFESDDKNATRDDAGKILWANIPQSNFKDAQSQIYTLTDLIKEWKVLSAHDITEGGLAVAIAEMTMPHQKHLEAELSVKIDIDNIYWELPIYKLLFSETPWFVIEVPEKDFDEVFKKFKNSNVDCYELWEVVKSDRFIIKCFFDEVVNLPLSEVQDIWLNSLRKKMK